jgi:putative ABC transport system permease protein
MVRLTPDDKQQGLATFQRVWDEIYPDYPANYTFLQDIYGEVYHNELNAESLVHIFSLLSLLVANLGLIIIMAFVIKRKTKEIGIRKVNGATAVDIIRLLNNRFISWIGVAFLLAVPAAYWVMTRWLQVFAFKIRLDWWIFAVAGALVLSLSLLAVFLQTWRAANLNPIKSLKTE